MAAKNYSTLTSPEELQRFKYLYRSHNHSPKILGISVFSDNDNLSIRFGKNFMIATRWNQLLVVDMIRLVFT